MNEIVPFNTIYIKSLYRDIISLKKPLLVNINKQNNGFIMTNEDLHIIAIGEDYDSCLQDFYDSFDFICKEYGLEKDENMTKGAKNLKQKILEYIH